jgi:hypothetical protein
MCAKHPLVTGPSTLGRRSERSTLEPALVLNYEAQLLAEQPLGLLSEIHQAMSE